MEISLAPLTLHRHEPLDVVVAAGGAGYDACGLGLKRLGEPLAAIATEPGGLEQARSALRAAGVTVSEVSNVFIDEDFDAEEAALLVRFGSALGAPRVQAVGWDPDADRAAERLAGLADVAAEVGLEVAFEFMPYSSTRTIGDAVSLIGAAGRGNVTIMLDALHLVRSGGTVEDVAAVDPRLIGVLQLCDGPLIAPDPTNLRAESIADRLIPGEGEFPLRQLIAVVRKDCPVSLEVPARRLEPLSHLEQARAVLEGYRRFVAAG